VTRRGRIALVFGLALYLVAWAVGSRALYPLALGLVAAVLASWLWMRLSTWPLRLVRRTKGGDHFEGEDVTVAVEVERSRGIPPGAVVLHEQISKLGERDTRLRGGGRRRPAP
jgi:uncharacterized protein (DUF58 family)